MRTHALTLGVLFLLAGLIYGRLAGAYFCGHDDFIEMQRAVFEDAQHPSHIWTTTHYESNKYRPLSRAMNDWSFWQGRGSPAYFRVRNLVFHWAAAAALYALGLLLFDSYAVARAAAALLVLHPLAHQSVAAAVFTNTATNAEFLAAMALFVGAAHGGPRRWLWLALAMIAGALSLHTYDSALMVFPILFMWLAMEWWRRRAVDWVFLGATAAGTALATGIYFALRVRFVPESFTRTAPVPLPAMVKNLFLYAAALPQPVDSVLAHDWWGTPLPSQIHLGGWMVAAASAAVAVLAAVVWRGRARLRGLDPQPLLFLGLAIPVSLAPFLLFTDHPSETYLYLPAAFYTLGLCAVLRSWFAARPAGYWAIVVLLAASLGAGTWVRNQRVTACAATAERILTSLPAGQLNSGERAVFVAKRPGEAESERYGIYGYRGLDTIGVGEYGLRGLGSALQARFANPHLEVRVVSAQELEPRCRADAEALCFQVDASGRVTSFRD